MGTFLVVIQIMCLSTKAHIISLSDERIRKIALGRKAIWTLILLVGIAGVLVVIIPTILGITRRFVGNESTFAKVMQNGVVPFFGKMSTIAHCLLYGFHMAEIRELVKSLKCCK